MIYFEELIRKQPIIPYIREGDLADRGPWRNPQRRLLDYLFVYFQKGKCHFIVDEINYFFQEGEFCLIQPGMLNDLKGLTHTITPFLHLDIFYQPNREQSFPTRPGQINLDAYRHLMQPRLDDIYGLHVPVRLAPSNPLEYRDMILTLVEQWQSPDPFVQLHVQQIATALIVTILEDHRTDHAATYENITPNLSWIPSYLSNHLQEPLSIEKMAKRAGLSPSRFSAVFKQHFQESPHQFLLNMRIRHACELLTKTSLNQEEIASYCGFANIHHFSKTFKKRMGMTPGAWRKS